jgi:hypothetical protein
MLTLNDTSQAKIFDEVDELTFRIQGRRSEARIALSAECEISQVKACRVLSEGTKDFPKSTDLGKGLQAGWFVSTFLDKLRSSWRDRLTFSLNRGESCTWQKGATMF